MYKAIMKLVSWIVLLIAFNSNSAQNKVSFEHLTILDGLSNSTVQNILQDKFGLLWFATSDGLNKYDGYNFTVYREDTEIPNSIAGNLVLELFEDSKGNLWIGTEKALNLYNRDTDDFSPYIFNASNNQAFYNGIIGIYEDHEGNLLLGKAYHGITKFDRINKTFHPMYFNNDSSTVSNFAIFDIIEDADNRLWYSHGSNFGIAEGIVMIPEDRSEEIDMTDSLKKMAGGEDFSLFLFKDSNNRLFFNSFSGNSYYIESDEIVLNKNEILSGAALFKMVEDATGKYWFTSTNNGLIKYDPITNESVNFTNSPNDENSISSNSLVSILIDATGVFWVGTSNDGINKFDPAKEPILTIKIPDQNNPDNFQVITGFAESKAYPGKTWVSTPTSVYLFDVVDGNLKEIKIPIKLENNLNIRSIAETNSDKLWIGTWGNGLIEFDLKNNRATIHGDSYTKPNFLTSPFIRKILNDNDEILWISTQRGVNKFNIRTYDTQRFVRFDTTYTRDVFEKFYSLKSNTLFTGISQVGNSQSLTEKFEITTPKSLLLATSGEAFTIGDQTLWDYGWIENASGDTIWKTDIRLIKHAGGDSKNFILFDIVDLNPGSYKLKYVSDDSHSFDGWNAAIPYDPNLWGIQLFSLTPEDRKYFENNLSGREFGNSIVGDYIRTVYKDSEGDIWMGSNTQGFSVYNPSSGNFTQYAAGQRSSTAFTNNRINSFLEESDNIMLLATFGGLIEFNKDNGTVINYTTNNGLPTNYLMDILKDPQGNIWISSLKGLIKMSRTGDRQVSFIGYDIKDGLQGYNFIQGSSYLDGYGNIFFGGEKGFNVFRSGNINSVPPQIVINKLKISNKLVTPSSPNTPLNKSISITDSIVIPHNQNDFSFEFTALHYSRPERNQYAYKLEGFDEEWNYDNRRFATYTNLDPGEYIFSIRASNSDGVWSTSPKELTITILPPWWQTIYAYLTYAVLIVFGFVSFNKLQKNKIITKERERQKIQEAELRAAAAEAQARAIQAENDRKTKELEEARNLQLSMLPDSIPNLPNLDIAVYMSTATEVGGDYYDFHIGLDGTLTAVIGDATGHGLNAGTMVTATKSLFSSHASNPDIIYTFSEISRCLREMRLRLLSMCLMIIKIKGNELTMSAAGIPPALLYRQSAGVVEEMVIKGMPLGAPSNFSYELKKSILNKGDTILLMSDGFPELFNNENEMYGYERIQEKFLEIGNKPAEEIISDLTYTCEWWRNGKEQLDDITFVVIKVK